jgi:NhaP-type Na+/H+ or K+/H+ antiporter
MHKKGVEDLLMNVIYLVIVALILGIFIVWLGGLSTGRLAKAQVTAKEAALVIDAAEPESIISINHYAGNISINPSAKEITATVGGNEFTYDYFSSYKISSENINETFSVIRVEK